MTPKLGLYGINKTNLNKSIMSKNVFPTYFPVAAALYLKDQGKQVHYIHIRDEKLALGTIGFAEALGLDADRLSEVVWNKEVRPHRFGRSSFGPPVDMIPMLDGKQGLEMEVKLTVIPTHAESKVTEMVVRQNTQFTFAERLAYCHTDLVRAAPVTIDALRRAIREADSRQSPFILHGVWQTVGTTHMLNTDKTADIYMISDFAYLLMLLDRPQEKTGTPTRIGRVVNRICTWLTDYFETGGMAYKITKKQSVDHLKVNLYPSDHLKELKVAYHDMRLSLQDIEKVIPRELRLQLAPERRLDASLALALMQES